MNKVLPPETAKNIIDTIIEQEGGHCSREVLYDIPSCTYYDDSKIIGGRRGGGDIIHAKWVESIMSFDYFSASTGLPMNKKLIEQYDEFLNKHLSKSPNTQASYGKTKCDNNCEDNLFLTYYSNSFGVCMLTKHRELISKRNIFDVGYYFYWEEDDYLYKLDQNSLQSFIEESDKIAEKYRNK